MVYVKDFAQMLQLAILADIESGHYNVGTGVGTTLEEQIRGIAEVFNPQDNKSEIIYCPEKADAPQYIMDIQAAVEELGYKPVFGYREMLRDMKQEMLKRGVL